MKKVLSFLMSICFCLGFLPTASVFANNETVVGGTYSPIYTTADGSAWSGTSYSEGVSALQRYYEAQYCWSETATQPTQSTSFNSKKQYAVGMNGTSNYAPILRFPLPDFDENEGISSAKLVTTIADTSKMSADITMHAYTGFIGVSFGSQFKVANFGSFAAVTTTSAGSVTISKASAASGDTLEIDVTEYLRGLPKGAASADFLLASEFGASTNYVALHRAYADTVANRPQLLITTKEEITLTKITSEDAVDVSVNDYVAEISFDRTMNPDTILPENITVQPDNIPVKRINFSPDYTSVKLAIGSNLLYNTQYTISFNENVASAGGVNIGEGEDFKFTTTVSDTASVTPVISSSYPKNGATNIKAINSISLNFSKEMYLPDISEEDFSLSRKNGEAPSVSSVNIHSDAKQVFVYFDEPLEYNLEYTLSISGLRDLDGKAFSGSVSFATAKPSVIITATDEDEAGTTTVTLNNVTGSEQTISLLAALYTDGGIFKDCIVKKDVKAPVGISDVTVGSFKSRAASDYVKVFGMESPATLHPILKTSIGSVDSQYYPGYTRKAVTLSYDDGVTDSDIRMIKGLNEAGLRATFNIIAGWSRTAKNWEEFIAELLAGNHEIANHSMSHQTNLGKMTLEEAIEDIASGENRLEYLSDCDVRGIAYPYGKPSANFAEITQYLVESGNMYARCSSNNSFEIPENFMQWDFTSHHSELYSDADLANKFFNELADDGTLKVLAIWGHAWNFDADEDEGLEETWTTIFEPFVEELSQKVQSGEVWNCTKIEFVEYINAVNGLVIREDSVYNPSAIDVYIKIDGRRVIVPAGGTVY